MGKTITIQENNVTKFRSELEIYTDSRNDTEEGMLWPLVEKVSISSHLWKILSEGLVLVDAPGLNDENTQRNDVVKKELSKTHCVLIMSDINRAVSDKAAKEMLDKSIRNQMVMDGQSVLFICTKTEIGAEPSEINKNTGAKSKNTRESVTTRINTVKDKLVSE